MKVSIILPTKNNQRTIQRLMDSIVSQEYKNIEIIHVDNHSTDSTREIVLSYQHDIELKQYIKGPERHIQRPYWYSKSSWEVVYFIDSDMYMWPWLVKEIVTTFISGPNISGLIVPEKNIVWKKYRTNVKAYERKFYQWNTALEAARVFRKTAYEKIWWWNQHMIAGEDWELTDRLQDWWHLLYHTKNSFVRHDEWELSVISLFKKKFYYWKKINKYFDKQNTLKKPWRTFISKTLIYLKTFAFWIRASRKDMRYLPWLVIMLWWSFFSMMCWMITSSLHSRISLKT